MRLAALLMATISFLSAEDLKPPVAKKVAKTLSNHGDTRQDDYFWLRDKTNPDVIAYLEAENRYTEGVMKHTDSLQSKLYSEILGRIKQTDLSVPEKIDQYFYYVRTEEGKQYAIYCRREDRPDAPEEILLDANELAEGQKYFVIGAFKISPDHNLLAYSTDTTGGEKLTVFVKDLKTGKLLPDQIREVSYTLEWANDNKTLYYVTRDAALRPYELKKHVLGAPQSDDPSIYKEPDETFRVGILKTRSSDYLFLQLESTTSTELRFRKADGSGDPFQVFEPRKPDTLYYVEHHGGSFYVRTNENDQRNFALFQTSVKETARKNWKPVMAHDRGIVIEDIDAFRSHLVITRRVKGLKQLRVVNLTTNREHDVDFPEPVYTIAADRNPDFNTTKLRFVYTSLVVPRSVYDYDMDAKTRDLKKRTEVLGGYDPEKYQSERLFAKASDGVEIPISLVYKKGLKKDSANPTLLYAYGSYGLTSDPFFSSDRLSLLDRGFIYAIAHIRGGGDMSRYWYEDGKMLKKKNTFADYIACAEHLVAQKFTSPEKLAAFGGSAGGLLMGAVINVRPDLFKVVIAKVPFVDVINTMLDASIPLTAQEYDEWGNPNEKKYYDYMKSYSPYDNVPSAKKYPHLMITTGLNDPRVAYWEPAKWTARSRALSQGDKNVLILKTNMGAGHGGASGRYERYKETAFDYAFILDRMGLTE